MSATLLQDYAARHAATDPSKVALVMADEQVTYGELDRDSNRLARLLIDHGCRPDDRVCLFTPKSPGAIVAMHAILKAGAAYVPIDPASRPPESSWRRCTEQGLARMWKWKPELEVDRGQAVEQRDWCRAGRSGHC